jgi:competence protein ComEC
MRAAGRRGRRFLAAALVAAAVSAEAARKDLVVTFLDCGQGDAAVLQMPGGKVALIDGGPLEDGDGFDAGRDVVLPFLQAQGIRRVDYLVISHPHLDHLGGFKHILENFEVGTVLDPGYSYPSPDYKDVLELVKQKRVGYNVVRSGQTLNWDPALNVRTLGPPDPLPWDDPNENSLIIQVVHGKVGFMFTGDVEEAGEYEMVIRHGPQLKTQVLKVAHHGSNTSTKKEFLDYVQPETAVISCGRFNRFRHPSKKILSRLEDYKVKVYRTDTQGHIVVRSDGKKYKVEPQGFSGN